MERNQQLAGSPERDAQASDTMPPGPLLSIGLAVYNGATHVRDSIDSLLAQDIDDLELIISDNASTDDTPSICREYADKDARVRYTRNDENIGAAANFNRVFELSRGRYFMWGSDDDLWYPRFARRCIERLERSPRAVMCTSRVTLIDEAGDIITDIEYEPVDTEGMGVERRIFEMTKQAAWFDTYSVIRPSALRATRMHLPTFGMDVRLQLELLLQGESLVVPEKLRSYRLPQVGKTASDYVTEISASVADHGRSDELLTPYTYLARELLTVVRESSLTAEQVARIENDLAETLVLVNARWGGLILEESGHPNEAAALSTAARRSIIRSALGLSTMQGDQAQPDSAWQPPEGMQLSAIGNLLLRLLQPFIERQHQRDARAAESIERLGLDVEWLDRRIDDLERRTDHMRDTQTPGQTAAGPLLAGSDSLPAGGIPRDAAWLAGEGVRLGGLRRTVLGLVQPFADNQNEENGRRADSVERALLKLGMVRRRVQALEHARDFERHDCDSRAQGDAQA